MEVVVGCVQKFVDELHHLGQLPSRTNEHGQGRAPHARENSVPEQLLSLMRTCSPDAASKSVMHSLVLVTTTRKILVKRMIAHNPLPWKMKDQSFNPLILKGMTILTSTEVLILIRPITHRILSKHHHQRSKDVESVLGSLSFGLTIPTELGLL